MVDETGSGFPEPHGSTTPLEPIPDRVEPVNFPYRGSETHGVPVEGRPWIPRDAEAQSWEGEEVYDPASAPIEPVPVIIVNESGHEIRSWRAWHHIATPTPSLLAGQNPRRSRIKIRNLGSPTGDPIGATIYISHESNAHIFSSWPIPPAGELTLETEEEVYCITPAGSLDVEVAVISEHAI